MQSEYLISTPHEFELTHEDEEGIEDLFYTSDQGFGANIQARASGALIQQLIANKSFPTDKTNSQLLKLSHFGDMLHKYISGIVRLTDHDTKLKELDKASEADKTLYARIKKPKKKKLSAVDFPNAIFPARIEIETGEIEPMKNIMLELKCHFPTSLAKLDEKMSDATAKQARSL